MGLRKTCACKAAIAKSKKQERKICFNGLIFTGSYRVKYLHQNKN
jgi:ribosomal protein L39E